MTASLPFGASVAVLARNVVAGYNSAGLVVNSNALLTVGHSVVTGNIDGAQIILGGTIQSYGDNDIDGNTNNDYGALTTIPTR